MQLSDENHEYFGERDDLVNEILDVAREAGMREAEAMMMPQVEHDGREIPS